jgi:hypothetical protein
MNAFNELFQKLQEFSAEEYKEFLSKVDLDQVTIETDTTSRRAKYLRAKGLDRVRVLITPTLYSEEVKEWLNRVLWAAISYDYYEDKDNATRAILKSTRTVEDEMNFIKVLQGINYNDGYGLQQLFGTIVFKDGTWMERREYDGSEWWEHYRVPTEPIWQLEDE